MHLTNAAIQREHTASASAADLASTLPQSHASAPQSDQQQPPTQPLKQPEHLDFLFPNDASLAGGSKISLAQWRALMTDAGFVFMFSQFAWQSICLLLLCSLLLMIRPFFIRYIDVFSCFFGSHFCTPVLVSFCIHSIFVFGLGFCSGVDVDTLWTRIRGVILKALICVQSAIRAHACAFELYGFDVMIDAATDSVTAAVASTSFASAPASASSSVESAIGSATGSSHTSTNISSGGSGGTGGVRPWLIECNASPSMECDAPIDWQVRSFARIKCLFSLLEFLFWNFKREINANQSSQNAHIKRLLHSFMHTNFRIIPSSDQTRADRRHGPPRCAALVRSRAFGRSDSPTQRTLFVFFVFRWCLFCCLGFCFCVCVAQPSRPPRFCRKRQWRQRRQR